MSDQKSNVGALQKIYFALSDGVKIHYMRLGTKGSHVVLIRGYSGNAYGNWYLNGIMDALAVNH